MKNKSLLYTFAIIWLAAIGAGTLYLVRYANTSGKSAFPPTKWPSESRVIRNPPAATLILFGHPNCPCSTASVGELNEIMAKISRRIQVHVAFVVPKGADASWRQTSLWEDAQLIPGVRTVLDEDGVEAKRFNAKTSGQVVLYDENGELVFTGGITGSRGHFGDNVGKTAVVSFGNGKKLSVNTTPVFGCSLFDDGDG